MLLASGASHNGAVKAAHRRRVWHSVHCRVASPAAVVHEVPRLPLEVPRPRPSADAIALFRTAKAQQQSGRRSDALATLQRGLAQFPTDRHMLSLTASLLTKSNQLAAARSVLHTALEHYPSHLPFVTATAMLEVRLGQHAAAVRRLEEAHAQFPDNAVLLQALGEAEAAAGNTQCARLHLRAALQLQPRMPHAYVAWAQLEKACGDMEAACALFSAGASAMPFNAPLLHAWATLEKDLGNFTTAQQLCEQALQADPGHIPSYMLLGELEWSQGRASRARDVWRRGNATAMGASVPLLCFWAQHEAKVHNHRAARELLQAALQASPQDPHAAVLLAGLEDRARAVDMAAKTYTQLLSPGTEPHQTQHRTQQQQQEQQQAQEQSHQQQIRQQRQPQAWKSSQIQQNQEQRPRDAARPETLEQQANSLTLAPVPLPLPDTSALAPVPALLSMAQHLIQLGQPQQAEQLLCQAEVLDPHNGHLCHMKGLLAQKEGLVRDAETWFRRGARAPAARGGLLCWEGLAELLAFLGKPDAARGAWRRGAVHGRRHSGWGPAPDSTPAAAAGGNGHSHGLAAAVHGTLAAAAGDTTAVAAADGPTAAVAGHGLGQGVSSSGTAGGSPAGDDCAHDASSNGAAVNAAVTGGFPDNGRTAAAAQQSHVVVDQEQVQPLDASQGLTETTSGSIEDAHGESRVPAPTVSHSSQPGTSASQQQPHQPAAGTLQINQHPAHTTPHDANVVASVEAVQTDASYVGLSSRYLRQWALFEKKSGRMDDAGRLFAAAAAKDPQDYKTWLAWAVLERRRGRLPAAEQLFRRGIAVAPHNPHIWHAYATMLWHQKGDVNSARATLRKAVSLCPRSVALWLEWGLLEWKGAGDPAAARQLLQQGAAVPLTQPYGPIHEALAQLERESVGRRRVVRREELESDSEDSEPGGKGMEQGQVDDEQPMYEQSTRQCLATVLE